MMEALCGISDLLMLAQAAEPPINESALLIRHLTAAVVFSVVGIVVLAFSFWLMEKLSPFSLRREIEDDQNIALGIVIGSIVIGISIIIAAAILG